MRNHTVDEGLKMSAENLFSNIIIPILMGLAFIVISLVFLYIIYGEKEEATQSASQTKSVKAADSILRSPTRLEHFLRIACTFTL
jgi:uncharacterized membrane protein